MLVVNGIKPMSCLHCDADFVAEMINGILKKFASMLHTKIPVDTLAHLITPRLDKLFTLLQL